MIIRILTTAAAPALKAFTMCPDEEIPPSAMIGTPNRDANRETLKIADICARPTAQTSCVVQMEPDPIPILNPSTPACMR